MVGCHHKIENAQPITFFCFIKPVDPTPAIPGEFEEELFFMASVSNMPNKTRNMMSVRPGHNNLLSLEGRTQTGPLSSVRDFKYMLLVNL